MPQRKMIAAWRTLIYQVAEDHPDYGVGRIAPIVRESAPGVGLDPDDARDPLPSDRAIGRVLAEFRGFDEQRRMPYRAFMWPDSMSSGALPWEASVPVLRLLAALKGHRPRIANARWYWHVTQAAPDAPISTRWRLACYESAREASGESTDRAAERAADAASVELFIAAAPWRSPEHLVAYQQAAEQRHVEALDPIAPQLAIRFGKSATAAEAARTMEALIGWPVNERLLKGLEALLDGRAHDQDGAPIGWWAKDATAPAPTPAPTPKTERKPR